jgi:hypothetical protein
MGLKRIRLDRLELVSVEVSSYQRVRLNAPPATFTSRTRSPSTASEERRPVNRSSARDGRCRTLGGDDPKRARSEAIVIARTTAGQPRSGTEMTAACPALP